MGSKAADTTVNTGGALNACAHGQWCQLCYGPAAAADDDTVTGQVYGLLDDSWERYSAFCEAYEAAGRDLPTMLAPLQLSERLPGPASTAAL
jgi:hypothetical protein